MSTEKGERKYMKIATEDRLQLIRGYEQEGLSIKAAGEKIGIKASTARAILKNFYIKGEVFEPKDPKKDRKQVKTYETVEKNEKTGSSGKKFAENAKKMDDIAESYQFVPGQYFPAPFQILCFAAPTYLASFRD